MYGVVGDLRAGAVAEDARVGVLADGLPPAWSLHPKGEQAVDGFVDTRRAEAVEAAAAAARPEAAAELAPAQVGTSRNLVCGYTHQFCLCNTQFLT